MDLVTFTEKILTGKLHFLGNDLKKPDVVAKTCSTKKSSSKTFHKIREEIFV